MKIHPYLEKDLNLNRKLKLTLAKKKELISQIESDAAFLSSHGIMDYSLLIGFHFKDRKEDENNSNNSWNISINTVPQKRELEIDLENKGMISSDDKEIYFVGMIDILQTYNLNKKSERFFKVHFLHQDKIGLSVQPVTSYYERFVSRLQLIIQASE